QPIAPLQRFLVRPPGQPTPPMDLSALGLAPAFVALPCMQQEQLLPRQPRAKRWRVVVLLHQSPDRGAIDCVRVLVPRSWDLGRTRCPSLWPNFLCKARLRKRYIVTIAIRNRVMVFNRRMRRIEIHRKLATGEVLIACFFLQNERGWLTSVQATADAIGLLKFQIRNGDQKISGFHDSITGARQ